MGTSVITSKDSARNSHCPSCSGQILNKVVAISIDFFGCICFFISLWDQLAFLCLYFKFFCFSFSFLVFGSISGIYIGVLQIDLETLFLRLQVYFGFNRNISRKNEKVQKRISPKCRQISQYQLKTAVSFHFVVI